MSSPKKIQRMRHPAYSPDFAPSDLFLFGCVKPKFAQYDIPDRQSLKSAIANIFDEIGQETFIAVFQTWANRFEWVIEHEWNIFITKRKNA
jgi:hypothetical protein